MKIIIQRKQKKPECVQGKFQAIHGDKEVKGYTLEPPDLNNENNVSCILPGQYMARVYYSQKYNAKCIRLEDKNGRKNIVIHPGNTTNDTRGCILVGTHQGECAVWESRKKLTELIQFVEESGEKKFPVIVRDPEV